MHIAANGRAKNEESLHFVQKAEIFYNVLEGGKQCRLARLIFLFLSACM